MPWSALGVSLACHAIAGLLLSVFSPPLWVWLLGLVSTLAQAGALAGPESLAALGQRQARRLVWLSGVGSCGLVIALAVAVNYGGTDNIDQIRPFLAALAVILASLLALGVGLLCTLATAWTGDQLLSRVSRPRSAWVLAAIDGLGLLLGGLVGVAIAARF
jgi:hypothetical protein